MVEPLIEIEGIAKSFPGGAGGVEVLSGVTLRVDSGELLAIMGRSGSGKTTLLNILGCLDRPTAGRYRFAGREISDLRADEVAALRNRHMGFVFQSFNLLPRLTALQNVELPLVYAGQRPRERRQRALGLLDEMGLAQWARRLPRQLSGGQQQRVAIARALANRPSLILADEPTGSLDSRSGKGILSLFQRLNRSGVTVVLVTHDAYVARHVRRIIALRDGRVVSDRANPGPIQQSNQSEPPARPRREARHAHPDQLP